ncbi:hypothetical protein NP493_95g01028 [Ridgeia piscesae]|uniref:Uncharacterized protein n=1 Tax=Ridgeia piscesae TaxID=27915 RepID=A0AAD9P7Z4_RIDPI|nr:hypothetical protein NP493_95g01028 [Ridgeia piscesae]
MGKKGGCSCQTALLIVAGVIVVGMAFFVVGFLVSQYVLSSDSDSDAAAVVTRTTHAPSAASTTPPPSGSLISIVFTFENIVTNDKREFRATTDFNTTRKTAYEIMRDIEKTDTRFRFTTQEHKAFGHYVTHVRGVKSDWDAEKTYWAFLKRTDGVDCTLSQGVSSYIPADGEHLVLSLVKSPNNLKSCASLAKTTTPPPEMITIVYTVESNHSTNAADAVFPASLTWNTPRKIFLQIMEDVQAANHTSFRFGVDANQTVTVIQSSLATADVHWMLLYRNATSDCTITEGVSVYIPANNDHLVLSLEEPDAHLRC